MKKAFYPDDIMEFKLNNKWYKGSLKNIIKSENKYIISSYIPIIKGYLWDNLKLRLHPNKIYIQHYKKGVKFTGSVVKYNRMYTSNSTVSNAYMAINRFNNKINDENAEHFVQSLNSYWGFMKHYRSYNIKVKIFKLIDYNWFKYMRYNLSRHIFEIMDKYKENSVVKYDLSNRFKFCKKYYSFA